MTHQKTCVLPVQLMGGAAEAKQSLTKLATDMSSWWAKLDPVPKSAPDTPKGQSPSAPETKARALRLALSMRLAGQRSSRIDSG